jgi:hypothetical protein
MFLKTTRLQDVVTKKTLSMITLNFYTNCWTYSPSRMRYDLMISEEREMMILNIVPKLAWRGWERSKFISFTITGLRVHFDHHTFRTSVTLPLYQTTSRRFVFEITKWPLWIHGWVNVIRPICDICADCQVCFRFALYVCRMYLIIARIPNLYVRETLSDYEK